MIILASRSPRRQELLNQIKVPFNVLEFEIDESIILGESPISYVRRIAITKAEKGFSIKKENLPVLAVDTVVSWQDQVFQKPKSYEEYVFGLRRLSNRTHDVLSALVLKTDENCVVKIKKNTVTFGVIPESFIEYYWKTGEPHDKAGGYAIQGEIARYIENIDGSFSGIMGLPLYELSQALDEIGYNINV